MKYIIYMHTSPSEKRYIGLTKQDLNSRWGKDGRRYERCTLFWRAIQKYGWENIKHEVLDYANSLAEANQKEKFYIEKYQTHDERYGYNCTSGGDGVEGWKATDEQKQKNSAAKKEMWKDPQMRTHLSAERKARGQTKAERERLSKIARTAWQDEVTSGQLRSHLVALSQDVTRRAEHSEKMKKKWETDDEFKQKMQRHLDEIHTDERIKKKHSDDMRKLWSENREMFLKNREYLSGAKNPMARAVKCVELNQIFETARAAEKETGVSYKNISNVLRGKSKTAGGFHWEYVNPLDKNEPPFTKK